MTVDRELDQLLRDAIAKKQLLRFKYEDNERIVEPHDYVIRMELSDCFAGKWANIAGAAS